MSHDTHHLDAAVMPERRRRILVTFGSTRGGTAEIGARIADVLREVGSNVDRRFGGPGRPAATPRSQLTA